VRVRAHDEVRLEVKGIEVVIRVPRGQITAVPRHSGDNHVVRKKEGKGKHEKLCEVEERTESICEMVYSLFSEPRSYEDIYTTTDLRVSTC